MKIEIIKLISKSTFRRNYRLWSRDRYLQFVGYVADKLTQIIDKETEVLSLSIKNRWKDNGGNIHVSLRGEIVRANQKAEIGGEIIWLKRLKIFRGGFWSNLNPKTDKELFLEAKQFFRMGKYMEFIEFVKFIEKPYSSNRVFKKMHLIAERRKKSSTISKH